MTAPAESISRLSRPAAHFDAPAVGDRSIWAEPSRACCVDAYRRSRNGGVAELGGEAQQQFRALPPKKPTATPKPRPMTNPVWDGRPLDDESHVERRSPS